MWPNGLRWSGPAASMGCNASHEGGVGGGPPVGRARKKLKPIQAPSPEMWSETISGSEEVLAEKWGGLFLGYLLRKKLSAA
jgi:hypothetical protein